MDKKQIQEMNNKQQALQKFQTFDFNKQWFQQKEFSYLLNWYSVPHKMAQVAKQILKKIACDYKVIFQFWSLVDKRGDPFICISVRALQPDSKLGDFVNHMTNLYRPIPMFFPFRITKNQVFTQYGAYEQSMNLECIICLDKRSCTPNVCCGKVVCSSCQMKDKTCPFCRQQLLLIGMISEQQRNHYRQYLNKCIEQLLIQMGAVKERA